MRALYLSVFLLSCKHVSELQVRQHQEAASAATTETHETKESGAEHIVMTIEEYQQLCPGKEAGPVLSVGPATAPPTADDGAAISHRPGVLVKRTVTVTDRGPSLDDLRSLSSLQSKVNTALAVHEEKKSGPVGLFAALLGLWPVILIGGAILAGVVAFKLKPPWLGFLFKLFGRAP